MTIHTSTAHTTDPVADARSLGERFAPLVRAAHAEYATLFDALHIDRAAAHGIAADALAEITLWAPDLADELAALAEGAAMSAIEVTALNARTEILASVPPVGNGECSTGVHLPLDGSAPRALQTWDWHDRLSNDTLVRRFTGRHGHGVTTFAEFGQLAKIGVNDAGLGVHFNILNHASDGGPVGVPVHVLARRILDSATTLEKAVEIARSARVSASSVITVVVAGDDESSTSSAAACIEISPAGVAVIEAQPGDTLVHTNHFLDPLLAEGESTPHFISTYDRFQCLVARPDAIAEADPLRRVRMVAGDDDAGVLNVKPRVDAPFELSWATKATFALDLVGRRLGYCEGPPGAADASTWRMFP